VADHAAKIENLESRLQFILEAARVGTWDWNILTGEVRWSENMEAVHGMPKGSFGSNFEGFLAGVHPDDLSRVQETVRAALENNAEYRIEYRQARADGSEGWMEGRGQMWRDEQGCPVRVTGICTDITSRKRAEQAEGESAARLRAIVETAADGIVTINQEGTVETFNPAAERILGYTAAEVIGTDVSMLLPEPHRSLHRLYLQHYLRTGQRRIIGAVRELEAQRKDGSWVPIELAVSETVLRNRRIFTGILRDISERKRAEEELRRTIQEKERLLKYNEELKQLTYAAAHDLREPLRAVSMCAQLLERRARPEMGEDVAELVRFLVSGAKRASLLIGSLLDYRSVSETARPLEVGDVSAALGHALRALAPRLEQAGAKVTAGPLPSALLDVNQISTVFQHLIGNALEHGGSAPSCLQISSERAGSQWVIAVRDNGAGIHPDYHERIFWMFKRLNPERSPGAGMGLPIARKIVERHRGRMWVESEEGQGATFFFTLPVVDEVHRGL
jgi:two-component system, LuxR family, sensor kinase FixL